METGIEIHGEPRLFGPEADAITVLENGRARCICASPSASKTAQCAGNRWVMVRFDAPTNEQGVVLLFGKMAEQLGFFVVGLQAAFPDCLAMREIAPGSWQPVTIEFEYESRNFAVHGHPSEGCDLIVCWEHNWKECPARLEVIALKDEMERVGSGVV